MPDRAARENSPSFRENAADAAALSAMLVFLALEFRPRLLLSSAVPAGGDTPSHYYTLIFLRDHLLPRLKLTGWTQANYAGFPLLEFYFPLSFLAMAAFSLLVSIPAAFKLGTVLGTFLLPPCAYFSLKAMRLKFPAPIFAAAATIPFLFMDANSYWGGNVLSALAGEFSYSLALALTVLWMGTLHRGVSSGKWIAANAVLLALIGLSHGYAILFAGVWSLSFLLRRRTFASNILYLIKMHGLAALLLSFWLVPLVARVPWTTAADFMLPLGEIKLVFPPVLLPFFAGAALALAFVRDDAVLSWGAAAATGALLYAAGPAAGIVDFRFLPFCQVSACMLAAIGASVPARRLRGNFLVPFLALALCLLWADKGARRASGWIDWNYSGFEGKPAWPVFSKVNAVLKGSVSDPRVVYEHSMRNESLGTVRAWETLPAFSGRSTLEHAYFQASPSAPFVFYLQSLVSKQISCPFPNYACAPSWNLARAEKRLDLFDVGSFIAVSDEVKSALRKSPRWSLKAETGPYAVYDAAGPRRYVVPLAYEPVLWTGPDPWKEAAYTWFRRDEDLDVPLVFRAGGGGDFSRFARASDLTRLPRGPVAAPAEASRERVSDDSVEFEAGALHKPYLVKVSYHPGWKVEGADAIYLVSPSFMLVYPNRKIVRLSYVRAFPEHLGLALSLLGLVLLALSLIRPAKTPWERAAGKALERRAGPLRKTAALAGCAALIWAGSASFRRRASGSDNLLQEAARLKDEKRWGEAGKILSTIVKERPVSRFAEAAGYQLAVDEYLQGHWGSAIEDFRRLLYYFPDGRSAPEAYFHIGLCYGNLGRAAEKRAIQKNLIRDYPASPWARYARSW